MSFGDYLKEADKYISLITSKSHNTDSTMGILTNYAKLFDLLLIDSEEEKNIFNHITEVTPEEVYVYIHKLYILNKLIGELPQTDPHKEFLQERLLNNINFSVFEKFEATFKQNPQLAVSDFVKTYKSEARINTVEVRTWGTENVQKSDIKATIEKKLRGDDVGHAALVMRVAADERGLELINKYCLDDDGIVKIPFELKKIGGRAVYEIYWSYWPGRLNTMEDDYTSEREGLEYRDVRELEKAVPKELSENYILYKFRGGKEILLAPASERTRSTEMQTTVRTEFLKKQDAIARIKEELQSIAVLKENYLSSGKEFSPKVIRTKANAEVHIKPTSNFLILLKRFKKELKQDETIARILIEKKISSDNSARLIRAIERLVVSKNEQIKELKIDCESILHKSHLLHKSEQKLDEYVHQQKGLLETKENFRRIVAVCEQLKMAQRTAAYPYFLSMSLLKALNKVRKAMNEANEDDTLIVKVIEAKEIISSDELSNLLKHLERSQVYFSNKIVYEGKGEALRAELKTLQEKYNKGRKYFVEVLAGKIEEVDRERENVELERHAALVEAQRSFTKQQQEMDDEVTKIEKKLQKTTQILSRIDEIIAGFEYTANIDIYRNKLKSLDDLVLKLKYFDTQSKSGMSIIYFDAANAPVNVVIKNKTAARREIKKIHGVMDVLRKQILDLEATEHKGPYVVNETRSVTSKEEAEHLKRIGEKTFKERTEAKAEQIRIKEELIKNYKEETITEPFDTRLAQLESKKDYLLQQQQRVKICSTHDYRDLRSKKLRRGIPYRSSVLHGFDIEKMLQAASIQAEKTDEFKLREENCSTTSMRLLNIGAPEQFKILFKASKPPVRKEYKFKIGIPPDTIDNETIYLTIKNGHLAYSMKNMKGNLIKEKEIVHIPVDKEIGFSLTNAMKKKIISEAIKNEHAPKVTYDGEAFLTNPQMVHNAAKFYQQVEKGEQKDKEMLDKFARKQKSKFSYYRLINKLVDMDDEDLSKLKNMNISALLGIIKKFILSPLTLINLIKEYFSKPKEKTVVAVDSLLNDMKTALEKLNDGKFFYIQAETPHAALYEMLQKLKENPTAIPFFHNDKLEKIRETVLKMESLKVEERLIEDKLFLSVYDQVMHERNMRLALVEDSLVMGVDTKANLLAHKSSISDLDFQLSSEQMAAHEVSLYEQAFLQKQSESYLPVALFNWIHNLRQKLASYSSNEEKLQAINEQIKRNPNTMSDVIMNEIRSSDPLCIKFYQAKSTQNGSYSGAMASVLKSIDTEKHENESKLKGDHYSPVIGMDKPETEPSMDAASPHVQDEESIISPMY